MYSGTTLFVEPLKVRKRSTKYRAIVRKIIHAHIKFELEQEIIMKEVGMSYHTICTFLHMV
jgi:hypothetical protein